MSGQFENEFYIYSPDLNFFIRKYALSADVAPYLQEIQDLPQEFSDSMTELKKGLETLTSCHGDDNDNKYPEVLFAGTGSAVPNKDRNVTGILLNIR